MARNSSRSAAESPGRRRKKADDPEPETPETTEEPEPEPEPEKPAKKKRGRRKKAEPKDEPSHRSGGQILWKLLHSASDCSRPTIVAQI